MISPHYPHPPTPFLSIFNSNCQSHLPPPLSSPLPSSSPQKKKKKKKSTHLHAPPHNPLNLSHPLPLLLLPLFFLPLQNLIIPHPPSPALVNNRASLRRSRRRINRGVRVRGCSLRETRGGERGRGDVVASAAAAGVCGGVSLRREVGGKDWMKGWDG
ncbi:hypothetical protein CJF30_00002906 [Rutstroemia sp. NJR-2017a BBW]|nr:hypothetical protein CJF30_00002906 [Rutstroemia sp. NJR-2017a BBW]